MTETLFAIGRSAAVVGRTRFCDFPPEAARIEAVGGFSDPNLERVVSLTPTLVCGERGPAGPSLVAALERHGLATYFPPLATIDDVAAMIADLGARLGASDAASRVANGLQSRLDALRTRAAKQPSVRAAFVLDWAPLVVVGAGTFPAELLAIAHVENVAASLEGYPRLSAEGLAALAPDVLIDGTAGAYAEPALELAQRLPGASAIPAIAHGRVHRLASAAALRPGPRLDQGALEIAQFAHGPSFDGEAAP
jgi:iron complex transport system substrate-binding protein